MPPKQRQIKLDNTKGAQAAMMALEERSDEELEAETKYRSAAMAILGARAAERYDAKASRSYFQRAIAAARPQERMQLRRMADASLALAERRADDLKVAVERLGHEAPSSRQLLMLRLMGVLAPPPGSSALKRAGGYLSILGLLAVLLAIGLGIVELIALISGGSVGIGSGLVLGLLVMVVVLAVLAFFGRRRQAAAQARARAERAG